MSNFLISDRMVQGLFAEPSVAELYKTERSVPNTIIFLQRALDLAPSAGPATLKLLGRVLKVGSLALGFLQIIRPPGTVQAHTTLATLKASCSSAANLFLAYAGDPQKTGSLKVTITEEALRALTHLEEYDPMTMHLIPVNTSEGIKIHIEGDGVSLQDLQRGHSLVDGVEYPLANNVIMKNDILTDYGVLLSGIAFPVEVLVNG